MRILSIDFDWVMEPFIQAYNQYSKQYDSGPDEAWQKIIDAIPAFAFGQSLEMDYNKYMELYFFIRDICTNNLNSYIYIGQNHNEIVPLIKEIHKLKGGTLSIVNIDHHHDLGYHLHDQEEFSKKPYDCTNWMYFLTKYYHIDQYIWLHNKNSETTFYHELPKYTQYISLTELADLEHIKEYDLIFICSSYSWVPLKYRPLFNILISDPAEKYSALENLKKL